MSTALITCELQGVQSADDDTEERYLVACPQHISTCLAKVPDEELPARLPDGSGVHACLCWSSHMRKTMGLHLYVLPSAVTETPAAAAGSSQVVAVMQIRARRARARPGAEGQALVLCHAAACLSAAAPTQLGSVDIVTACACC